MFRYFSNDELTMKNGTSATVSIGNWIVLMLWSLLSIIPIIGFIVYIVAYLVLAFRQETAPSVSNFIKANLIVAAVGFVIGLIIIGALIGGMGAGFLAAFSNL